jgi:hypothetical protein
VVTRAPTGMTTKTALWHASLPLLLALAAPACGSDDDSGGGNPAPFDPAMPEPYEPAIPSDLGPNITNPLFPFPVGATWTYQATTEDGLEEINLSVEAETRVVHGVEARVVRDTVTVDGEVIEDTWDWYAQDGDGNVWYLGEDTTEYENGEVVCHCGAWEWGMDDALPGVVMLGEPQVGDVYRQEYLAGEAEDYAEVMSVDETLEVAGETFTGCVKTNDRSAIDPELDEFKYYCPGIGTVLVEEPDATEELIEYSGL